LGAVALHVAGLLLSDHRVFEYLKPTAPLYQLAGIFGRHSADCADGVRHRRVAAAPLG
jgi:hypothetical protein